jgi:hypothetical protein
MAKGAAESGAVESYMCNKIKRNPVVASRCAAYLGEFEAEEGANGIQKDTQWLVRLLWCWSMLLMWQHIPQLRCPDAQLVRYTGAAHGMREDAPLASQHAVLC